jgi:hypothetical protein
VSVIAELAWKKMRVIGQDLEHFAKWVIVPLATGWPSRCCMLLMVSAFSRNECISYFLHYCYWFSFCLVWGLSGLAIDFIFKFWHCI